MRSIVGGGAVVLVALAALACGGSSNMGGGGSNTGTPASNVIKFGGSVGNAYTPASLTVNVGDTVTWEGDFTTHPLVSGASCGAPDGKFGNGSGSTYSFTFTAPGTYPYNCSVHCTMGMKGTITVQ
jgi:plastocyanin